MDTAKIEQFAGQIIGDLGAMYSGALGYIGDRLGLYKAMAGAGWLSTEDLGQRTGCAERYLREWCAAQAAAGYIEYDGGTDTFRLSDEHAAVLADDDSPAALVGAFSLAAAAWAGADRVGDAFRTGAGVGWHEHDARLAPGCGRFYASGYRANLLDSWIPALSEVDRKLRQGARVLDVGCGHGAALIMMAAAYPQSQFLGVDYHEASIEAARKDAVKAGVADRVEFAVASATDYEGGPFDLVWFFDSLHDLGDPVAAIAHARQHLAADGTLVAVEPQAGDRLADNMNPFGRAFYGGSTLLCTPNALSQKADSPALGAQAGPGRLIEVIKAGGFSEVHKATESPVNIVLEARP